MSSAGEVSRGEKMLESGTDPESYITDYSLVYEGEPGIGPGLAAPAREVNALIRIA